MHSSILFCISFTFLSVLVYGQADEKQLPPPHPAIYFEPSAQPDRVLMTIADEQARTRTITWRTNQDVPSGTLQWSDEVENCDFYKSPHIIEAVSSSLVTFLGDTVYYHHATLYDLQPGKSYVFRVGNDPFWSEWFDFSMKTKADSSFQFVYLGDAQNDVLSLWSRVFRKANQYAPKADFIVHAGDLINHSQNECEWAEWFDAGGHIFASKPQLAVPGNHEYVKDRYGEKLFLTPSWTLQFPYPENGLPQLKHASYFLDYKNCRFVFLDSNNDIKEQGVWLKSVLERNNQKWVIIVFHHPVISAINGRENEGVLKEWKPILDQFRVDLVLQGHDHVYGRGRILDRQGKRSPTTYVVSMAGRKSYAIGDQSWMEVKRGKTQTFQVIEVSEEQITFQAYTMDNSLLDAFKIVKENGIPTVIENK